MAIDPDKASIGRRVVVQEYVGGQIRRGIITSYSPAYIYVQFDGYGYSEAWDSANVSYEEDFLARHR